MAASSALPASDVKVPNRWLILLASIVSMVAVANFQYGWTLFVLPLQKHLNQTTSLISVTFTVFVLLETWLVPFEGWLVDKFGPRLLVMLGGVLAGLGWVGSGKAESLSALYISYAVAGIGAGIVYGTAVGIALKWFPEHRGLAAGLTAAGFGAGSALTVAPLANMINPAGQPAGSGYQHTFIVWGIIQGLVVVVAALFLKAPPDGWLPKTWRTVGSEAVRTRQGAVSFTSGEMTATPHFWLMYLMMAMVATGGLMATAQLAPMARDFGVDKIPVKILFWVVPALTFALQADRVINGLCRPFWGWVSDHIGREKTMTLAFGLEAVAIFCLLQFARNPLLFVLFSAFTFFGWAEIFSLFPALCGDFFGRKHATANYGFLYTAKGTSSMFVPIGAALAATTAAGRAFDFRADILLLLGGAIVLFTVFLAPTLFRMKLPTVARGTLLTIAAILVTYGIVVTVLPAKIWTPFQAKFMMPQVGWKGVFSVAIVCDLVAAALAFFVLRRMKAPELATEQVTPAAAAKVTVPGAA
ncbi:MAG TPA: oxalate/formate MFS antiporter [Candidatus Angelobacter sp.]|nr:oxalate/formate MFS antiporter [Candidatus Angelobacter sp.]